MSSDEMDRMKIRVFVIEDEYFTHDALRVFLSQDPRTVYVGGAQNPSDAIEAIRSLSLEETPDVFLLDIRFRVPEGAERLNGIDLLQEIGRMRRKGELDAKVLCLSMSLDPRTVISALSCGADGYLDKNQVAEGIIDAIELVHEGHSVISPNIAEKIVGLVKSMREGDPTLFPDKPVPALSTRTEEVAYLYYRCGMTAKEIADELFVSESTVRTHIKKIKAVLEASSRPEVIQKLTKRF